MWARGSWGGKGEDKGTEESGGLAMDVDGIVTLIRYRAFALKAAIEGRGREVWQRWKHSRSSSYLFGMSDNGTQDRLEVSLSRNSTK